MTTLKIAVSLPEHLVRHARRAVARSTAPSVSAYVAEAMEDRAKLEDLEALLEEMLAESGGPLTREEARAADVALGLAPAAKRPAKRRRA